MNEIKDEIVQVKTFKGSEDMNKFFNTINASDIVKITTVKIGTSTFFYIFYKTDKVLIKFCPDCKEALVTRRISYEERKEKKIEGYSKLVCLSCDYEIIK